MKENVNGCIKGGELNRNNTGGAPECSAITDKELALACKVQETFVSRESRMNGCPEGNSACRNVTFCGGTICFPGAVRVADESSQFLLCEMQLENKYFKF